MNKPKIKSWLHRIGLAIVAFAAIYVVARQGLSITEKITAFGVLLTALLTALGKVMPVVDKAIDDLPDDKPTVGPGGAAAVALLAGLLLSSCSSSQKPTPGEVGRVVVDCAVATCAGGSSSGPCAQLAEAVIICAVTGGNAGACLSGLPAALQVAFADVACVADAIRGDEGAKDVAGTLAGWLKAQRVDIKRGGR